MLNHIGTGRSRATMEELILTGLVLHALKARRDVDVAVRTDSRGNSDRSELAANAFGKQFEIIVRERTSTPCVTGEIADRT
jgi:hypothetical protein